MDRVRNTIRNLRGDKRFSQEAVADMLGISQAAYHRIENGPTAINVETLEEIAKLYEVSPAIFFEDYSAPTTTPSEVNEAPASYAKKESKRVMVELSLTDEEYADLLPLFKKKIDALISE